MILNKEEYILPLNISHKEALDDCLLLLSDMRLISNLKSLKLGDVSYISSYNRFFRINIEIDNLFLFIEVLCSRNNVLKLRNIINKHLKSIKIYNSEFFINKNIIFFTKFIKYENYLRKNIIKKMFIRYGSTWWVDKVDKDISRICVRRSKHDNNRLHEIFYSDFMDLKKIILDNWLDLGFLMKNNKDNIVLLDKINKKRNNFFHGRYFI